MRKLSAVGAGGGGGGGGGGGDDSDSESGEYEDEVEDYDGDEYLDDLMGDWDTVAELSPEYAIS